MKRKWWGKIDGLFLSFVFRLLFFFLSDYLLLELFTSQCSIFIWSVVLLTFCPCCGSVFMFFIRCLSHTHTIPRTRIVCARQTNAVGIRWMRCKRDKCCLFISISLSVTHTSEWAWTRRRIHAKMCVEIWAERDRYGIPFHCCLLLRWDIFVSSLFRFVLLAMFSEQFSVGHFRSAVFYLCGLFSVAFCVCVVFYDGDFENRFKLCISITVKCALDNSMRGEKKSLEMNGIFTRFQSKWLFQRLIIIYHRNVVKINVIVR